MDLQTSTRHFYTTKESAIRISLDVHQGSCTERLVKSMTFEAHFPKPANYWRHGLAVSPRWQCPRLYVGTELSQWTRPKRTLRFLRRDENLMFDDRSLECKRVSSTWIMKLFSPRWRPLTLQFPAMYSLDWIKIWTGLHVSDRLCADQKRSFSGNSRFVHRLSICNIPITVQLNNIPFLIS